VPHSVAIPSDLEAIAVVLDLGLAARVGMQGGTKPLARALVTGIWQVYALAASGGNGQIATSFGRTWACGLSQCLDRTDPPRPDQILHETFCGT
jgi:hypothetical protein